MTPPEAKIIIASYLTGQTVARQALADACEVVKANQDYARYLAEELGLHSDWSIECELFLSRVAEFSEMSQEEREREAPELSAHAESCQSCRHTYWNLAPLWISAPESSIHEQDFATVRWLAERIRLVLDQPGRLFEEGLGPPSITQKIVAATAGSLDSLIPGEPHAEARWSGQVASKEWLLIDENAECALRLIIGPLSAGEISLVCNVEEQNQMATTAAAARVEVREFTSRALRLAGRLSDFQTEPIFLPPGDWIIRIQSTTQSARHYTWEIPLQIVSASSATGGDSYVGEK